jgi:hypothetical protein
MRAKGKRLGRPPKVLDTERIAALRAQGLSWKRIAAESEGLGSEGSIGSPERVPRLRKGIFEPCDGLAGHRDADARSERQAP